MRRSLRTLIAGAAADRKYTDFALVVGLLIALAVGLFARQDVGLADNGDFVRSSHLFAVTPEGGLDGVLQGGREDSGVRHFQYWIPRWEMMPRLEMPTSSVVLLWLPGLLASGLLTSGTGASLSVLAVFLKALIIAFASLVFLWLWRGEPGRRRTLLLVLGVPLILMLSAFDYVVYYTSFYQEAGALVYLPLFLAALVALSRKLTIGWLLATSVLLLLLSTSKSSMVYWPALGFFLLPLAAARSRRDLEPRARLKAVFFVLPACAVILVFTVWFTLNKPIISPEPGVNPYHSLFYGVLPLSDNPGMHLSRLGISEAAPCVGVPAFGDRGKECFRKTQVFMSFENTTDVLLNEPRVVLRLLHAVACSMQDLSLEYLGHYRMGDPRGCVSAPMTDGISAEERTLESSSVGPGNLWTVFKFWIFPRGPMLWIALGGALALFVAVFRESGLRGDLSLVGIAMTIGCASDMTVAFLGDGKWELIKHLVIANAQFDYGFIALFGCPILHPRFKGSGGVAG